MSIAVLGLAVVFPAAVPERIDAELVPLWVSTRELIDDRPPKLAVDPRIFVMADDSLAWPREGFGTHDWQELAADLASFETDTAPPPVAASAKTIDQQQVSDRSDGSQR